MSLTTTFQLRKSSSFARVLNSTRKPTWAVKNFYFCLPRSYLLQDRLYFNPTCCYLSDSANSSFGVLLCPFHGYFQVLSTLNCAWLRWNCYTAAWHASASLLACYLLWSTISSLFSPFTLMHSRYYPLSTVLDFAEPATLPSDTLLHHSLPCYLLWSTISSFISSAFTQHTQQIRAAILLLCFRRYVYDSFLIL